jgi:hypothetical protein
MFPCLLMAQKLLQPPRFRCCRRSDDADAAAGVSMLKVVQMLMLLVEVLMRPQMCCYGRWW